MLRHRNIDRICIIVLAAMLVITSGYTALAISGMLEAREVRGTYADKLFDTSTVHTVDIVIDNWDKFLETCTEEKYSLCSVVIDGEKFSTVAIRGKGNTSLSSVKQYGNNRYSFKLEFDHYQEGKSYHGLDKLCLNNLIQDATYMKDYIAYTLMNKMGVPAPLCSFVKVNVNGEYWGLYLAVEAIEDAFLTRNYGSTEGELYKPDTMSMGGGKGFGEGFRMSEFREKFQKENETSSEASESTEGFNMPEGFNPGEGFTPPEGFEPGGGFSTPSFGGIGSSDVKLQYTDDDIDSYSSIFENAKTDATAADKARLIASLKALNEGEDVESAVDVDEVIRYFVVHSFLVNGDSYTGSMIHNYYLYEQDGVLSMLPWDYNLSLGAFSMGGDTGATSSVNDPIDTPVSGGDVSDRPMLAWIFSGETYTEQYHQVYREFMEIICDSGWLTEEITRVRDMIAPYVESDPTAFFTYEEFEKGVDAMLTFFDLRAQSVAGQLDGTIPSTDDGQDTDGSALIDASALSLSDMGGMMNGGGPGSDGGGFPGAPGGGFPGAPDSSSGDGGFPGGDFPGGSFPGMPSDGDASQIPANQVDTAEASAMQPPSMPGPAETQLAEDNTQALIWFAASLLMLVAGLIFAKRAAVR